MDGGLGRCREHRERGRETGECLEADWYDSSTRRGEPGAGVVQGWPVGTGGVGMVGQWESGVRGLLEEQAGSSRRPVELESRGACYGQADRRPRAELGPGRCTDRKWKRAK